MENLEDSNTEIILAILFLILTITLALVALFQILKSFVNFYKSDVNSKIRKITLIYWVCIIVYLIIFVFLHPTIYSLYFIHMFWIVMISYFIKIIKIKKSDKH